MAEWEIVVDRELCMGSGTCYLYVPNTFEVDDGAKSFVKQPDGDPLESIRTAIEACPTGALKLIER